MKLVSDRLYYLLSNFVAESPPWISDFKFVFESRDVCQLGFTGTHARDSHSVIQFKLVSIFLNLRSVFKSKFKKFCVLILQQTLIADDIITTEKCRTREEGEGVTEFDLNDRDMLYQKHLLV